MVFAHDVLVEPFDVRTPVVLGRQNPVVLELHDGLLNRDSAEPEFVRDLVAVQPVSRPELAGQYQVDDVRDHEVFFLDPILLGHGGDSLSRRTPASEPLRRFGVTQYGDRASGTAFRRASGHNPAR